MVKLNTSGSLSGLGCSALPQRPKRSASSDSLSDWSENLIYDEKMGIEELELRIWRDRKHVKRLKKMAKNGEGTNLVKQNGPELSSRRVMRKAQDRVLRFMFKTMERTKAQAFVYGIVLENGRTITGSSDNLREWWKDKVRFSRNGPTAMLKHHMEISSSDVSDVYPQDGNTTAVKLLELQDTTLGAILSALLPNCNPPQRKFPLDKGVSPPWWPTGKEDYWEQLPLPQDCRGLPPPYRKPHDLKKLWKVGVLIGVIRHMSTNFDSITKFVRESRTLQERMTSRDASLWLAVLTQEKTIVEQSNGSSPENNSGFTSLLSGNNIDLDELFDGLDDYDVEGTDATSQGLYPEFENIIREVHKSRSEDEYQTTYTCENMLCLYSQKHMGFQDKRLRDHHQLTCPHNATDPFDTPGLVTPEPSNNQMQEQVPRNNQMQQQVPGYNQMQQQVPSNNQMQQQVPSHNQMQQQVTSYNQMQQQVPSNNQMQQQVPSNNQMQQQVTSYNQMQQQVTSYNQMQQQVPSNNQMQQQVPGYNQMQQQVPGYNQMQQQVPGYNQMQQQVPRYEDQFNASNNVYRPTTAQRGDNSDFVSELLEGLNPSPALMNHDPSLEVPVEFNGNVGMQNNQVSEEQDWIVPWLLQ